MKPRHDSDANAMKRKYVRTVKIGNKWDTYLQIGRQGFCVVEQTTKKRAEWYGTMLASALTRVANDE